VSVDEWTKYLEQNRADVQQVNANGLKRYLGFNGLHQEGLSELEEMRDKTKQSGSQESRIKN